MSTVLFDRAHQAVPVEEELRSISERLDRVVSMVEALDRRREELEELVTDLMPAVNGTLGMAMRRLDALEKSGVLDTARTAGQSLEAAAATLDPDDLAALAGHARSGVRTLRVLTAPDVQVLTERSLAAVRDARKGKPWSFKRMLGALREPRVRRGLSALIGVMRVLGEGTSPADAAPGRTGVGSTSGVAPRAPRGPAGPVAPTPRPVPAATPGAVTPAAASERTLGGRSVQVDGEGFLLDRKAWTPEIAEELAREAGVSALTEDHWRVIDFCREDAGDGGAAPGMRRITAQLGTPARDLYRLFPGGPGILAARIAGLGKPKSCV